MSKRKKKDRIDTQGKSEEAPAHTPFADFFGIETPALTPAAPTASPAPAASSSYPKKVLLRMTKKGRGGKTVTLVTGFEHMDRQAQEDAAKAMRQALGCGTSLEDDGTIIAQGDQRDRLEPWLEKQGVEQVKTS